MKKINEQTKSFLLYGIEDVIKPKEIYKLDGAILFLVFLFFFLSESAPSPFFSKVFLVIVYLGFVILSFSRTEVTGKKVFWIIGIQSLTFSILFCWAATILMLTTMKEEYYKRYLTILVIIYILVIAAYIFLIITLIKKDIYNPSSSKKLAGGWCITSFVLLGMGVAKVLSSSVEYTAMIRIASLCSYYLFFGFYLRSFSPGKVFCCQKMGG